MLHVSKLSLSPALHRGIFIFGLLLIVSGVFFSLFMVSLGGIILAANWLWEGNLPSKLRALKSNKAALVLVSVFFLHILGLLWTQYDFDYALKDIRIKLPLLLFPVVFAASPPLKSREIKFVAGIFILSAFVSSMISYYRYLWYYPYEITDIRDISGFISHIRFSLLLITACIFIFAGMYRKILTGVYFTVGTLLILWFVYFISLLNTISGVFGLILVIITALILFTGELPRKKRIVTAGGFTIAGILLAGWFAYSGYDYLRIKNDFDYSVTHTPRGEKYIHDYTDHGRENGYYISRFIAEEELEKAWNERSDLDYKGKDKRNQPLNATLKRFITSKGLKKDREGVEALTEREIKAVESGIASVRYLESFGFMSRYLKVLYELDHYFAGADPQGHSVAMRFEFLKAGFYIFKENPWIGVGTGDVPHAYEKAYSEMDDPLNEKYRFRAHNQFLTMALTFGIPGLLLFPASFLIPIRYAWRRRNKIYAVFLILAAGSMLSEDTLETQIGVTFYAFFNAFFLFLTAEYQNEKEEK